MRIGSLSPKIHYERKSCRKAYSCREKAGVFVITEDSCSLCTVVQQTDLNVSLNGQANEFQGVINVTRQRLNFMCPVVVPVLHSSLLQRIAPAVNATSSIDTIWAAFPLTIIEHSVRFNSSWHHRGDRRNGDRIFTCSFLARRSN